MLASHLRPPYPQFNAAGAREVWGRAQHGRAVGPTSGVPGHVAKPATMNPYHSPCLQGEATATAGCLAGPPSANERLALTLIPFEFPRPFDTFDTWPFLVPLCSEMLSNTLFGKESPPFDTFDTLAVLKPNLANSDRMAFGGGSKHHLNTQNHRK